MAEDVFAQHTGQRSNDLGNGTRKVIEGYACPGLVHTHFSTHSQNAEGRQIGKCMCAYCYDNNTLHTNALSVKILRA